MAGRRVYSFEEVLALFSPELNAEFALEAADLYVEDAVAPFGLFPRPRAGESFPKLWKAQKGSAEEPAPPKAQKKPAATWKDFNEKMGERAPEPQAKVKPVPEPEVFASVDVSGWGKKPDKKEVTSFAELMSADKVAPEKEKPVGEAPKGPVIAAIRPEQFAAFARPGSDGTRAFGAPPEKPMVFAVPPEKPMVFAVPPEKPVALGAPQAKPVVFAVPHEKPVVLGAPQGRKMDIAAPPGTPGQPQIGKGRMVITMAKAPISPEKIMSTKP